MLAGLFLGEAATANVSAFDGNHHAMSRAGCVVSAIANGVLAWLVLSNWPSTAAWVLGLYAGINLIVIGASVLAIVTVQATQVHA